MRKINEVATKKYVTIDELGELHEEHANRWDVIVDMGYKGVHKLIHAIIPKKNTLHIIKQSTRHWSVEPYTSLH